MEKIHKPMGKPTPAQENMFFQPVMQQLNEPEIAVWVFAVNGSLDHKHIHKCVCDYTIECSTIELPNFKMNFGEVALGTSWKKWGLLFHWDEKITGLLESQLVYYIELFSYIGWIKGK